MSKDVQEYVKSCDICQRTKYTTQLPPSLITPLNVPTLPWNSISMDFISMPEITVPICLLYPNIKTCTNPNYRVTLSKLWGIVDRLTSFKFLITLPKDVTASMCTESFNVFISSVIGYAREIVCDRDTIFNSIHFRDWCSDHKTKLSLSTAYYPQSDVSTEVANKAIKELAREFKLSGKNWAKEVPNLQQTLNLRNDTARKQSLFFTLFGFEPNINLAELPLAQLQYMAATPRHDKAAKELKKAKQSQATQANKRRKPIPVYPEGTLVLQSTKYLLKITSHPKSEPL